MKHIKLLITVLVFLTSYPLIAQDIPDPDAVRILNTFNQYKARYFQIIKDSLESNFKRDNKYYKMYPELRNLDTF